LVAGAGGFIGGHLAANLLSAGYARVRCVDIKELEDWQQVHPDAENVVLDLRDREPAERACEGIDEVFDLACDMGGMGFIERNRALCMLNVLINTNLLLAARERDVSRFFFASSACVYRADLQDVPDAVPLREEDAVEGIRLIHGGHNPGPVNLGSSELVTLDQLVDVVEEIAGVTLERIYDPSAPTGVRGRNSDNSLIKRELGWEPSTPLAIGMEKTYAWIYDQLAGTSIQRRSIR
jgi:nucleoside-diphosphate-sugar epimerase